MLRFLLLAEDATFTVQYTNPWSGKVTKETYADPDVAQKRAVHLAGEGWVAIYVMPTEFSSYKTSAGLASGERAMARRLAGTPRIRVVKATYTHDAHGNVVTVAKTWARIGQGTTGTVVTRTFGEHL